MKFNTSRIAFAAVLPALSCSKSIQDAPVGSVGIDSLLYSPDTDIVADVAVDGIQREDRRLQASSPYFPVFGDILHSNGHAERYFRFEKSDWENTFGTFLESFPAAGDAGLITGTVTVCSSNGVQIVTQLRVWADEAWDGRPSVTWVGGEQDGGAFWGAMGRTTESNGTPKQDGRDDVFNEPDMRIYEGSISCDGKYAPTSSPSDAPTSSPSAAPTRDMFDWGISAKNDDVVVFSDATMQREVVLKYFLSNKVYNVTIKTKNCSVIVPSNVISYDTTDDVLGSKNNATVWIDINQSSVENSVVWSTPEDDLFLIDFCVRLDLWYGDISMNFLEREVSLKVNMTSQNFTLSAANLDTTEGEEVNENVEAAYEVIACQCTDDGSCVTSQEDTSSLLSQGSSLYVCLRANTTDVIVDSVKELTIAQGGTLNAQVPIINGVNQGAVASEKLADMQNEFLVRTQLISAYFEDDTNDLTVSGVAKLAFKSGRKLSAKIVDVRNLQAQDQDDLSSQFGLNVNIQSGSNEDDLFSGGNVVDFIFPFASVVIMGIVLPAISALVM